MTTPTRRWARTDATQQRILDAATEVFSTRGFSAATMADIVDAFGRQHRQHLPPFRREEGAVPGDLRPAVGRRRAPHAEAAREATDLDSQQAFAAHVRAYLDAIWENRRAAMMMASGDVPADFEATAPQEHADLLPPLDGCARRGLVQAGSAAVPRPDRDHVGGVADGHHVRRRRRGRADQRRHRRVDRAPDDAEAAAGLTRSRRPPPARR